VETAELGRVAGAGTRRRRVWLVTAGLLTGPLLWLFVFFILPIAIVALYSFGVLRLLPTDAGPGVQGWTQFFSSGSIYLGLFWKSVRMALTASVVVVLLAYPVAYFLALVALKRKYVLLLLTIAPFLTSYLLRVLAWKVILGSQGVINSALFTLHLRSPDHPVSWLLYSQFSVILVLSYIWVPFVALPIFVSLENLDRGLLEAASDLGASRWRIFWKITFPLSLPGVAAAFVFVFIPTLGEFITPLLVGGTSGFMYGNAISDLFTQGLDWRTGAVLSIFLLAVVAVLIAVFGRFLRVQAVETD
jgi:spermidine/putrescine transport system permease protein